jgi:hypothetical protein
MPPPLDDTSSTPGVELPDFDKLVPLGQAAQPIQPQSQPQAQTQPQPPVPLPDFDKLVPLGPVAQPQPQAQAQPPVELPDFDKLVPLGPAAQPAPSTSEPVGFLSSLFGGIGASGREAGQLATGEGFNPANVQEQPERTFMGGVGYGLGHSFPTLAGMVLGAAGGGAAGTAIEPGFGTAVGGALGGAAGGGVTDFVQSLVPAYQDAIRRGATQDEAVDEAYKMAGASGAFTGVTAPLFGLSPFKSVIKDLLFHTLVTGPGTGVVKQGVIDPAITGQPTPGLGELAEGAVQNAIGGGIAGGVMHYGPQLGRRIMGPPTTSGETAIPAGPDTSPSIAPTGPAPTSTDIPPRPTPFTDLVRPPPEGVAPGEAVPITTPTPEPPPIPPRETPPNATTAQPRPGEPAAAPVIPEPPAAVPTGAETARPGMEPTARPVGTIPVDETRPGEVRPAGVEGPAPPAPEPAAPRVEPTAVPGQREPVPGQAEPPDKNTPAHETPGTPAYKLGELDRANAPDEAYRDALSTGSKDPLKPGETWRDRLVKWVEQERAAATAGEPETSAQGVNAPGTTPAALLADQEAPGTLESRAGFRRKAPAPGEPEPTPNRVRAKPPGEPVVTPHPGDPLTMEDYAYSRGTSAYRDAPEEALRGTGINPKTFTNRPILEQNKILADQLKAKYGFTNVDLEPRTVTVTPDGKTRTHPAVEPKITRDWLLNVHHNMQNMAHALGWSQETVALNGRLGLHLVPYNFKGENWYGSYSFADKTIHISGGSNSYAHEHWHAIDDYMTDLLHNNPNKQQLLTWSARDGALDPKDPVQSAFVRVLNAMSYNRGEEMLRRLRLEQTAMKMTKAGRPTTSALLARAEIENLDKGASKLRIGPSDLRTEALRGPNPQYWASHHELFARVGEAYTAYRMEAASMDPAGVVKSNKAYQDRALAEIRHRYPNWIDRMDMFHAFDQLVTEMERASTLSQGQPPAGRTTEAHTLRPWSERPADIRPGFLTSVRNDLSALRWSNLVKGEHEPLFKDPNATPAPLDYSTRAAKKTGVATPKTLGVQRADDLAMTWNSALGNLDRMIKQMNPAARPFIQGIRDKLGSAPGSGRPVDESFEERIKHRGNPVVSEWEDALKDAGLKSRLTGRAYMNPEQNAMFRHTMQTGETTYPLNAHDLTGIGPRKPIPENILAAAEKTRFIEDRLHDQIVGTEGLEDTGYASGHVSRVFDDRAIRNDKEGSTRDRTRLNQFIFDNDMKFTDPRERQNLRPDEDKPERLYQWWRETPERDTPMFSQDARDAMAQLGKNLNRIKAIDEELKAGPGGAGVNPTTHDPIKLGAERDQLVRDNLDIHDEHVTHIRDQIAHYEAQNWWDRIAKGDPLDFATMGPDSRFTKGRTLPPEADQIMRDWMHKDMLTSFPNYAHGVARKIAFTELFGADGRATQNAIDKAVDHGMNGNFSTPIRQVVEAVTGRSMRGNNDPGLQRTTNMVSALGQLMLLPGASISAVGEPFGTLLAGGSPKMMFGTFTRMAGAMLHTPSAAERMAGIRAIGGTTSVLQGAAAASRYTDYAGTPTIEKFMHRYFELALSPVVRWIRAATYGAGTQHIKTLLDLATDPAVTRRQLDRQADAKTLLHDWYAQDHQFEGLKDLLRPFNDVPDRVTLKNHPMGPVFEVIANRMLNRMSQDPTAAEKPLGALRNPMVNMLAGLTSFPYGFMRNVVDPAMHRAAQAKQREWDRRIAAGESPTSARFQAEAARFKTWVHTAIGGLTLLAGTGLMFAPRSYLFNQAAWQKHEDDGDLFDWLLGSTIDASGLLGPLAAVGQAFTALRYTADLSNLVEGPYLATETRYMIDIIKGVMHAFGGSSDGTNTETYNAIHGLTQLTLKPGALASMAWLANRLPAGPLSGLIGAMSIAATSPTVTRGLTDFVAGPRGTKIKKESADPFAPPPLEPLPLTDLEQAQAKGESVGGGPPSWMIGLTDDILVPAMRVVPGWGKPLLAGGAALGGVGALLRSGHHYKTEGEPPAKAR